MEIMLKIHFIENKNIEYDYKIEKGGINFTASLKEEFFGQIQGRVFIVQDAIVYNIPILSHLNHGSIQIKEKNGEMIFEVLSPKDWEYAKISVTNKNNKIIDATSVTPTKAGKIKVFEYGEYWVEAQIRGDDEKFSAYETVYVKSASKNKILEFLNLINIPERPIMIIVGALLIMIIVGFKIRK
jgi:hypothetical protein